MEKKYVILTDINGMTFTIETHKLIEVILESGSTVCGLTFNNIVDLKLQYELKGGFLPPTSKSIKDAFQERKEPKKPRMLLKVVYQELDYPTRTEILGSKSDPQTSEKAQVRAVQLAAKGLEFRFFYQEERTD